MDTSSLYFACTMSLTLKQTIKLLYEGDAPKSYRFRYALFGLDIVTMAFLVLSSFFTQHLVIDFLECFFGVYILLDFSARLYIKPKRLQFAMQPYSIIDIVVIFSFLVPVVGQHLAFLRALSVFRLLRSSHFLDRLRRDFPFFKKYEDMHLSAINLLLFIFVMTELVYQSQVRVNDDIRNFVDAMYFTVTTLTTTGFGDIVLQGSFGKLIAIVIMICGVSLFLRLVQTILRPHKVRFVCPACALNLHDRDAVHCKSCGIVLNIPDEGLY